MNRRQFVGTLAAGAACVTAPIAAAIPEGEPLHWVFIQLDSGTNVTFTMRGKLPACLQVGKELEMSVQGFATRGRIQSITVEWRRSSHTIQEVCEPNA